MRTIFWVTGASLVTSALLTVAVADFVHRRNQSPSPHHPGAATQAAAKPATCCPVMIGLQGEPMPSRSAELAALAGLPEQYFTEEPPIEGDEFTPSAPPRTGATKSRADCECPWSREEISNGRFLYRIDEVLPCHPVPVENTADTNYRDLLKEIEEDRSGLNFGINGHSLSRQITRTRFDCCEACPLMAACRWMNQLCDAFVCGVTEGRCCYEISECPKACRVGELAKECDCHKGCKCETKCSCAKNESACSKLCSCAKPAESAKECCCHKGCKCETACACGKEANGPVCSKLCSCAKDSEQVIRKVYPIEDLLVGQDEAGNRTAVVKPATLDWLIESAVAPDSWERNGGIGRIDYWPIGQTFVIVNSAAVQEEIAAFLEQFRKHQAGPVAKAEAFPGCDHCPAQCPRIIREVCPRGCERIGFDFTIEINLDPSLLPGKLPSRTAPEDMAEASAALLKDFDRLFADGMYLDALLVAKLAHQLDPLNGKAMACAHQALLMCDLTDPSAGVGHRTGKVPFRLFPDDYHAPRRAEPPTPEELPVCEPERCPYRGTQYFQGTQHVPAPRPIVIEMIPVLPLEVTIEASELAGFLIRILASPEFVDATRSRMPPAMPEPD